MSVARQEHAGPVRGGGGAVDLGRLIAAVEEALDSEDLQGCFYAWQEMARQERRAPVDDAQRAAIKAMNKRVDDMLAKRAGERIDRTLRKMANERIDRTLRKMANERIDRTLDRMANERAERRYKWYSEVGIHRDLAKEVARRSAFLSC